MATYHPRQQQEHSGFLKKEINKKKKIKKNLLLANHSKNKINFLFKLYDDNEKDHEPGLYLHIINYSLLSSSVQRMGYFRKLFLFAKHLFLFLFTVDKETVLMPIRVDNEIKVQDNKYDQMIKLVLNAKKQVNNKHK